MRVRACRCRTTSSSQLFPHPRTPPLIRNKPKQTKPTQAVYAREGVSLPHDPQHQLQEAVSAVFRSWNTPRAVKYREITRTSGLRGTAVNVQVRVSLFHGIDVECFM